MFFFLDEKEPKNQAKTPNPFFFTQKAFASPPEKLGFRSVLAEPTALLPTYTLVVYNSFQSIVKSLVYVKETASITLFIGVLFQ